MDRRADGWRRIAESIRPLPGRFGLREHTVDVVHTSWTGGRTGVGERLERRVRLLVGGENPKIKFPSQRDLAQGMMSVGSILIGPFTPQYLDTVAREIAGGTDRDLIDRTQILVSNTVHILVTGPQHTVGAKYTIENLNRERAIRFSIQCNAVTGNG